MQWGQSPIGIIAIMASIGTAIIAAGMVGIVVTLRLAGITNRLRCNPPVVVIRTMLPGTREQRGAEEIRVVDRILKDAGVA